MNSLKMIFENYYDRETKEIDKAKIVEIRQKENTQRILESCFNSIDASMTEYLKDHFDYIFNMMYMLPASEVHHHNEVFGLITHTIDTLEILLKDIGKKFVLDLDRFRYTMILGAIYHDVGKIYRYDITKVENGKTIHWNHIESLIRYCYEADEIYIKKRNMNYDQVNAMSLYIMNNRIKHKEQEYIGVNNMLILTNLILEKNRPESAEVVEADKKSGVKDIKSKGLKGVDIAAQFFEALKDMIYNNKLKVNEPSSYPPSVYFYNEMLFLTHPNVFDLACKQYPYLEKNISKLEVFMSTLIQLEAILSEDNKYKYGCTIHVELNNKMDHVSLPCVIVSVDSLKKTDLYDLLTKYNLPEDKLKIEYSIKSNKDLLLGEKGDALEKRFEKLNIENDVSNKFERSRAAKAAKQSRGAKK